MNRLSDDTETVSVCVKMPKAMRDALDRQIIEHGYTNRSEAARAALEVGLNPTGARKTRSRASSKPATNGCAHPIGRRIGTGCGACGKDPA